MWDRPAMPMQMNHTAVIGPNTVATLPVPKRCTENRTARMTSVIGTTKGSKAGVTTFRPSTADRTEMAGVMMASPKNRAAPHMPMPRIAVEPAGHALRASAISDSVPPSPLLSALSTKTTYLMVTMMVSAQTISDSTP